MFQARFKVFLGDTFRQWQYTQIQPHIKNDLYYNQLFYTISEIISLFFLKKCDRKIWPVGTGNSGPGDSFRQSRKLWFPANHLD